MSGHEALMGEDIFCASSGLEEAQGMEEAESRLHVLVVDIQTAIPPALPPGSEPHQIFAARAARKDGVPGAVAALPIRRKDETRNRVVVVASCRHVEAYRSRVLEE